MAIVLLFTLVASEQIRVRKIDGWRKIETVLCQHTPVAACDLSRRAHSRRDANEGLC